MADDHINLKASSNGTVYAIVKTGYDTSGTTQIGLLVRRPTGSWDSSLYRVSTSGTRGIVELNESHNLLMAVYTSATGFHNIVYRTSPLSGSISFSSEHTLLSGLLNNAQSTKQTVDTDVVVVAGNTNERMNGIEFVWSTPRTLPTSEEPVVASSATRTPLFSDDLLDGWSPIPD